MLDRARAVVERTRSQALAVARADLLNDLAGEPAKGVGQMLGRGPRGAVDTSVR